MPSSLFISYYFILPIFLLCLLLFFPTTTYSGSAPYYFMTEVTVIDYIMVCLQTAIFLIILQNNFLWIIYSISLLLKEFLKFLVDDNIQFRCYSLISKWSNTRPQINIFNLTITLPHSKQTIHSIHYSLKTQFVCYYLYICSSLYSQTHFNFLGQP